MGGNEGKLIRTYCIKYIKYIKVKILTFDKYLI